MTVNRTKYAVQLTTFFLSGILFLAPDLVNAGQSTPGFDKVLELDDITYHVTCANEGSLNDVTIVPSGLTRNNDPVTVKEADGTVTGADVADLNKDGSPEVYIYMTSAGSGSYGSLIAYSANNRKSLGPIYLPPLEDDKINSKGYMGHDQFSIKDNRLVRSFPVYKDGDSNAKPTGGTRELEYELISGEASWQLKLVKSSGK